MTERSIVSIMSMTERDNQDAQEWMSVAEVAALLKVTRRTVDRYIRGEHLPATRLPGGRLLRIRRADVEALLSTEASA